MKQEMLFKDWLLQWNEEKKIFVKESTYAHYHSLILNHIIPVLGKEKLQDITEPLVQEAVLFWCQKGRMDKKGGLSRCTIQTIVSIIKESLKSAAKNGWLTRFQYNITFPSEKISTERVKTFTEKQKQLMENYILKNMNPRTLGILLCLHTGMRIGEICALQWKDVDWNNKSIRINKTIQRIYTKELKGKGKSKIIITMPKSSYSIREIPLDSSIYNIINRFHVHTENDYVITGNEKFIEPRTYRNFYNKLICEIGLSHINFHGLRHTFATCLIERGADYKTVSELLGHSSINMTMNLYVHPQMEQKRKAVELLNVLE